MLAFDKADGFGATGFETDLRLTRDGYIVLSHDDNLKRFGLPDITVSKLSTEEATRVEIASPDNRLRAPLITLESLLRKYPEKDYIFDCKITDHLMMTTLGSLLKGLKFHDRIWFLTWSHEADQLVEDTFPGYAYFPRDSITIKWGLMSIIGLERLAHPQHKVLALPPYHFGWSVFSKKQVEDAGRRNQIFLGYLVNTERDFKRCVECGVKYILSDRPDLLHEFTATQI